MQKRKNDKGIVLQQGERQLPDGRYRYRYTDSEGRQHDVYSWRLRPQDPVPEGKKPGISLREMEENIRKDLEAGVKAWSNGLKVAEMVDKYLLSMEGKLGSNTLINYRRAYNAYIKKSSFGRKSIKKVTPADIQLFYEDLIERKGLKLRTIGTLNNIIFPAFERSRKEKLIQENPAKEVLSDIKKKYKNVESVQSGPRHAIPQSQLESFLDFVKNDRVYKKHYNLFYLLSWTGCRINEMLALSWYDIDFEKEVIMIRRSVSIRLENDALKYYFKLPKSKAGIREIPMLQNTKKILTEMRNENKIAFRPCEKPPVLSPYDATPLVFKSRQNNVCSCTNIDHILKRAVKKYNRLHTEQISALSSHIFRHCFTCWLIENLQDQNPSASIKAVQKILGHADASTTLNIYSELRKEAQDKVFEELKNKARL